MYLARILYPVRVLGPGQRIGIWFSGCPHHCDNCSNPELWEQRAEQEISIERATGLIYAISEAHPVDGFTITGGDPFAQPEALAELVDRISEISTDILAYSGYTMEELVSFKNVNIERVLSKIAILIDGRYCESLNHGSILKGSDNQVIHKLNPEWEKQYDDYIVSATNQIQNFSVSGSVISVGIHEPGFSASLDQKVRKRGMKS